MILEELFKYISKKGEKYLKHSFFTPMAKARKVPQKFEEL